MVFGIVMKWITGQDDASEGSSDYELTTTTLRFFSIFFRSWKWQKLESRLLEAFRTQLTENTIQTALETLYTYQILEHLEYDLGRPPAKYNEIRTVPN